MGFSPRSGMQMFGQVVTGTGALFNIGQWKPLNNLGTFPTANDTPVKLKLRFQLNHVDHTWGSTVG